MKTKLFIFLLFSVQFLAAQNDFTGTVRGTVIDKAAQFPIPGANIVVIGSNPIQGASTDLNGNFKITQVAVGRISLKISFLGYEPMILSNLQLNTGKELIVNVLVEESFTQMKEVVIEGKQDKFQTNNEMTTVSARSFSVEESQRYAGARGDVARMAANFAGVRGADDSQNNIIIRGNSPNGLLWRFEGIDIPNPNHYGGIGASGGPVSMLNNNVLANSDFITGAFPAEYGNATSGVFDLKMRNGNNEKHEFLGQIGFNGFELGAEGPIAGKNKGSYLINYRYSTLGVFKALGVNFGTGTAVPYYQDLSFKLNLPTSKFGRFEVFALGGLSTIELKNSDADTTDVNFYNDEPEDIYFKSGMGVAGISNTYLINNSTFTKFTLAATYIENSSEVDTFNVRERKPVKWASEKFGQTKYTASFFIKKKFSSKLNAKAGVFYSVFNVNLFGQITRPEGGWFKYYDDFAVTQLIQPYVQAQYRITEKLTANFGFNVQHFAFNNQTTNEPRVGISYQLSGNQNITFAYGLHSMIAPFNVLLGRYRLPDNSSIQRNRNLGASLSHHYVAGYDWRPSENWRLKTEVYYQNLFDIPVSSRPSSVSGIDFGSTQNALTNLPDSLSQFVNKGIGRNYGLEVTAERSLNKGFYAMATVSIYQSEYKGSDGVWRNTVFNGNYVGNVVAGKEIELNSNKETKKSKQFLVFDTKFTVAGGQRYTPILVNESIQEREAVYDIQNMNSAQFADYLRWDIKVSFRQTGKKVTQEFGIDCQNILNRQNPFQQQFNLNSGTVNTINQLGLLIIPQYKILF